MSASVRQPVLRVRDPAGHAAAALLLGAFALASSAPAVAQDERRNYFDDPFVQVTAGLADCPVPQGPLLTAQEARAQAHGRVDRGTTCYRSGRCRLPNAYLYDKDLVARVRLHLSGDERFTASSVWIVGQRRWIFLEGCVATQEAADAMERAAREVDDVEAVIPELMIGTGGTPRYVVAAPASAASAVPVLPAGSAAGR
jgi:hypothetical protein